MTYEKEPCLSFNHANVCHKIRQRPSGQYLKEDLNSGFFPSALRTRNTKAQRIRAKINQGQ